MSKEIVAEVIALIELGMIAPEDIVKCLRKANSEPAQQEPVALDVIIEDEEALAALRDTVVQSDGDLTAIRLLVGNGHAGYGLYVSVAEYQEEGAFLLAHTSPPAQRKPLTDEDLIECERLAGISHRIHMRSIRGQQLSPADQFLWHYAQAIEAKLKEKNT